MSKFGDCPTPGLGPALMWWYLGLCRFFTSVGTSQPTKKSGGKGDLPGEASFHPPPRPASQPRNWAAGVFPYPSRLREVGSGWTKLALAVNSLDRPKMESGRGSARTMLPFA